MHIADKYAALKNEIDALTKELDKVKAEIKATGCETLTGERAIVTVSLSEREMLDTKAVKLLLTDEQIAACTKKTLVETLRVKANVTMSVLA